MLRYDPRRRLLFCSCMHDVYSMGHITVRRMGIRYLHGKANFDVIVDLNKLTHAHKLIDCIVQNYAFRQKLNTQSNHAIHAI